LSFGCFLFLCNFTNPTLALQICVMPSFGRLQDNPICTRISASFSFFHDCPDNPAGAVCLNITHPTEHMFHCRLIASRQRIVQSHKPPIKASCSSCQSPRCLRFRLIRFYRLVNTAKPIVKPLNREHKTGRNKTRKRRITPESDFYGSG
jgi:hypothetical protein